MSTDVQAGGSGPKPTLLLIRYPLTGGLLHQLWEEPYITAFSRRFNVVLVEEDCDLSALCDRHSPDLIAYRGAYSAPHRRIEVSNPHVNRHIPRISLCMCDCFCTSRIPHFRDMDAWGCEVMMAHVSVVEQTPEMAHRTFGMPHVFDDGMCIDPGVERDIPIWLVGAMSADRPWRVRAATGLSARFPDLVQTSPHPGYGREVTQGLVGETFFRTMGRARISLTDGTLFDYVVRKHLEIPACGTLLLTPPIQNLADYGFQDMVNCVMGEGDDLTDKVDLLLRDEARLRTIAGAGHDLVHHRHAASKSDFLYDWFVAQSRLRPGQTLIQNGLFGPYEAVWDGRQGLISSYQWKPDPLTLTMRAAGEDYARGDYAACINRAQKALEMRVEHAPARFMLNRALLRTGRAAEVLLPQHGLFQFNFCRTYYQTPEADPVELAWWVLAHICGRQVDEAEGLLNLYAHVRHAELRRVRWLIDSLRGRAAAVPAERHADDRPSVMHMTAASFSEWMADIMPMIAIHWQGTSA
ncbi:glycosyltransferase [Niveispirillum cyanobacteriorum]|uniref:Spore protein YkvP/CgeB glycosyl transferase-like domain-containing protein n=1 Tax=Niveispirillum cyanobacteriorum TaxID=1612173 RepID=A0A2K9NIL7_9PROT|nr:glycosyltransferase [Niveispirillum cyanobacteriorum]AUN32947.1 hypothetical protein C0V82_21225 [Niveispirillum cyanobacteriorum]GGE46833.1 hypothetical protein GCM10011317_01520 [Niveispirillum cyanobacteriorum]